MAGGGENVRDACMFDIMELPEATLKQVLPKVSIRIVSRLIASYPRAIGRTLLNVMSQCSSPMALELLREEMGAGQFPSIHQIQEAEKEFLKTLYDEKIFQPKAAPALS